MADVEADANAEAKFGRPPPLLRDVGIVAGLQFVVSTVILLLVSPPFVRSSEEGGDCPSYRLVAFVAAATSLVAVATHAANVRPADVFRGAMEALSAARSVAS